MTEIIKRNAPQQFQERQEFREFRARPTIARETEADVAARENLLDRAFGAERRRKTCERLREGRLPAPGLAFAAHCDGKLVGTLRFWSIEAGPGRPALLLGPIAVDPALRSRGLGARMIEQGLRRAAALGHHAVLLVGDEPYYRRFGFRRDGARALDPPGPVDLERFLALELRAGALSGAQGLVRPTGAPDVATAGRRWRQAA